MFFAATSPTLRHRIVGTPARHSLERFLDDALATSRQKANSITQDDKAFTLTFDVPGIARDQLNIGIEGNIVRIQSKEDAPRSCKAAYELPLDIDVGSSEAKLENGVLTLKLAKVVAASKVTELLIS